MRGSGAARCPSPRQGARESCHRRAESEVRCEGLRCVGLYPQGGLGRARNIAGAPEAPGMDGRLDAWTDAGCAGVEVPSGATGHEYRVPEVAETERGHRDAEKQRGWVRPDGAQRGGRTGGTSRARRTLQNPSRSPRSTAGQGLSGLMAAQSAVCFPRQGELRALPRGGAGPAGWTPGRRAGPHSRPPGGQRALETLQPPVARNFGFVFKFPSSRKLPRNQDEGLLPEGQRGWGRGQEGDTSQTRSDPGAEPCQHRATRKEAGGRAGIGLRAQWRPRPEPRTLPGFRWDRA